MPDWSNFEDSVFVEVQRALANGTLPFAAGNAKVKRSPSYPSANGKVSIPIEVSVEVCRPGAEEPFLISLWEGKHKGNRKVEVGVIRELRSKIEEIGVGRCSGAVVTTNGFQAGAIELAKQHGIWLLLLERELVWVSKYSMESRPEQREVLSAVQSWDNSGTERSNTLFADIVRLHFRRILDVR